MIARGTLYWLLLLFSLSLAGCGPNPAPTATPAPPANTLRPTAIASASARPLLSPSPAPVAAAPTSLVLLANADSALSRHDLTTAFRLYRQAAADDNLGDPLVDGRSVGPDLGDFARFRIVLLDAIVGQDDDARAVLEQLRADPDRPFAQLALFFWDSYGMTAEIATACRQVNQLVREDPDAFLRPLNAGPNGLGLTPDSVCLTPS